MIDDSKNMGNHIIAFAKDDYSKAISASLIDAKNDAQTISSFLLAFRNAPLTLMSYSKEIERLLLWCIHIAKLNIAGLRHNHLMAYQDFLKNPEPKNAWIGAKVKRQLVDGSANPNWRPFGKALSPTTINKVITILDSFFNYLVQSNYLTGNPLAVDRRRKKRNKSKPQLINRYLEIDEIYSVLNALSQYAQKNNQETFQVVRSRYIILLLFYTGLRIAEAANHTMGNFIQREENWFLRVTGKGKKLREIPAPDDLLDALANFRKSAGLPSSKPKFREKTPLIPMQNLKQSISTRRIDQILKWAFNLGAQECDAQKPHRASKLRQASAHWLRHSYVTHLLDSGAPLKVVQENAGHSDVATTTHYRDISLADRYEATRTLSLSNLKRKRKTRQPKHQD